MSDETFRQMQTAHDNKAPGGDEMDRKLTEALKRYNMVEVTRRGETESEMREAKNGEWVRFEDLAAWNRRTPAETVSREAIGGPLKRVWEWFWTIEAKSPEQLDLLEKEAVAKMTDAIYALQLPAPQPVSTGYSREQVIEAIRHFGAMVATTERIDDYLASRPPVPSVVGVPSVEELANAFDDGWARKTQDGLRDAVISGIKAIHAHLLTSQPDMGALVEADEAIMNAKVVLANTKLDPVDIQAVHDYLNQSRKALAAIKEGVQ